MQETLAALKEAPCEKLFYRTLKSSAHVLGKPMGDMPYRGEPMLATCCCCCTPCCSCSAAVEEHPLR